MVLGTMIVVTNDRNPATNQIITTITGDYNLGGGTVKRKTLNIRSVQAHIAAAAPRNLPPAVVPPVAPENTAASLLDVADRRSARTAATVAVYPALIALAAAHGAAAGSLAATTATAPPAFAITTAPTPRITAIAPPPTDAPPPVTIAHATEWFVNPDIIVNNLNNRHFSAKLWQMKDAVGELHGPCTDTQRRMSRLDYLLLMVSPKQLLTMLNLTNMALLESGKRRATMGELLKLFRVMILAT